MRLVTLAENIAQDVVIPIGTPVPRGVFRRLAVAYAAAHTCLAAGGNVEDARAAAAEAVSDYARGARDEEG